MKKTIFKMTMVLFISAITFSGCKKGEDDPGISFRSRTARLEGNWKLSSMDYTEAGTGNGENYTNHYTYSGTTFTNVYTSDGYSDTDTGTLIFNMDITKDGTYSKATTYDGYTSSETGNWLWVRGNDEQDLRKKEAVLFASESNTSDGDTDVSSGKTNLDGNVFVIKRLANEELVFLFDYTHKNSDGSTSTMTGTWTFIQ